MMATKGVLKEAIRKLQHANVVLREKAYKAHGKDKTRILSEISRNESMILDYEFRLKNE